MDVITIELPIAEMAPQVAAAAGQTDIYHFWLNQNVLHVRGVTLEALQQALASVIASFDPQAAGRARTAVRIATRRYQAEVAGITLTGMPIDTGRDSQGLIAGAALAAVIDPQYSVNWKGADGQFVSLSAQQIIAVASAVRAHVQACFDREAALLAELAAGTFTEGMLEEGWPNG